MEIVLDGVSKSYDTRGRESVLAVAQVDLRIRSGEFVSIVGPSGCGKTTILDMLLGVIEPTTGSIGFTGGPRGGDEDRPGVVLQSPTLLPWRTVRSNVVLPAQCGPAARRRPAPSRPVLRARADELLRLVQVAEFADRYPWELSGGMQQRVAIARALFLKSSVMCFDEPFSALDEFTRESLHAELQRIWMAERFTGVFVTHSIQEAVLLSDRIVVMAPRPGRIVADIPIPAARPRHPDDLAGAELGAYLLEVREALRAGMAEAA